MSDTDKDRMKGDKDQMMKEKDKDRAKEKAKDLGEFWGEVPASLSAVPASLSASASLTVNEKAALLRDRGEGAALHEEEDAALMRSSRMHYLEERYPLHVDAASVGGDRMSGESLAPSPEEEEQNS